jgi:hypothetical protein
MFLAALVKEVAEHAFGCQLKDQGKLCKVDAKLLQHKAVVQVC